MRDEHRPKQDLIHEVAGLRKQVLDLRDAMTARRRVEEALRAAETLLRALADGAAVGLCLFRRDGTPIIANRPFARMLGYDSPAELVRIGGVLGIFASPEERARVLGSGYSSNGQLPAARFRLKDGSQEHLRVIGSCPDQDSITVVVFDRLSHPPAGKVESLAGRTDQG